MVQTQIGLTFIKHVDYNRYFVLLVAMAGAHRLLTGGYAVFETAPPLWRLLLKASIGAALGWMLYFIISAIWSWVGTLFKGKGNHRDMYTCLIYALLPSIVSLIVLFPVYLVAAVGGIESWSPSLATSVDFLIDGVLLISGIWSLVNVVTAIAVVHEFSIGKAILTFLFPAIVVAVFSALMSLFIFIL